MISSADQEGLLWSWISRFGSEEHDDEADDIKTARIYSVLAYSVAAVEIWPFTERKC